MTHTEHEANREFFERYRRTLVAYRHDPVVQHMAADLIVCGIPAEQVLDYAGSPRITFQGRAAAEYRQRGGALTGHLSAPAEAAAALAYRTTRTAWQVNTSQGDQWRVGAATWIELAKLITLRAANELALPASDLQTQLSHHQGGTVYHSATALLTFTIHQRDYQQHDQTQQAAGLAAARVAIAQ